MLNNDWDQLLKPEFEKPYFIQLKDEIIEEYQNYICFPPIHDVFHALRETSYHDTKVLILGQDPYHNEHQAMVV